MTNLRRRLKKLEASVTDDAGLVPHSPHWLTYWCERIDDLTNGRNNGTRRIPLEALDAITPGEATN